MSEQKLSDEQVTDLQKYGLYSAVMREGNVVQALATDLQAARREIADARDTQQEIALKILKEANAKITVLQAERDKLALFKRVTHEQLDEMGAPQFEQEACRMRARMQWVKAERDALKAECERMRNCLRKIMNWQTRDALAIQEANSLLGEERKDGGR